LIGTKIRELTLNLTKTCSVVGTTGERVMAEEIYSFFADMDYFKTHPEQLEKVAVPNDPVGRFSVLAWVKGEKSCDVSVQQKAVLCLGHIDTAGIEDYGDLKSYATNSEIIKQKLKAIQFSEDTAREIESEEWLFGRGIFDMKAGVAAQMIMMEEFSKRLQSFSGVLVFIGVPDEEGNSAGMLSVVPRLEKLAATKCWDFQAAVNTDYMTTRYPGDENKYIYIGTVGKLLPCFYIYGEETHVGEAFNGLDANLLASELLRQIDFNTEFCDIADSEVAQPPVSLQQRDLKKEYSVQTVNAVSIFFNHATHNSQPAEVLMKYMEKAALSFQTVIDLLNEQYKRFCLLSQIPLQKLPWQVCVMTFDELYAAVKDEVGSMIDQRIEKIAAEKKSSGADDREISLAIVQEVHSHYSNQNSKIVVYFAPPYYPHMFVDGSTAKEQKLLAIVEQTIKETQEKFSYTLVTKKFYPFISDLSYCNISHNDATIAALTKNMPAWMRSYSLPVTSIQNISMPVVNIGPFGKDAHKLSERLCTNYSFDAMPFILEKTLTGLLK
jgi:arginine utilization protein RocB